MHYIEAFSGSIYCDMDQVLVNFLAGAKQALGKEFNDPSLGEDREKWLTLSKIPDFWKHLDWMPGAQRLWERIKDKDSYILSACPRPEDNPACPCEKRGWTDGQLRISNDRVHVVRRSEKRRYARNADGSINLLIDDHPKTVGEWRDDGGIAILHTTVPETMIELDLLGL